MSYEARIRTLPHDKQAAEHSVGAERDVIGWQQAARRAPKPATREAREAAKGRVVHISASSTAVADGRHRSSA